MKKIGLFLIMALLPLLSSAETVEIDGVFYNLSTTALVAEVTENPNKYSGDVVIPEKITYEGVEYTVTIIGELAFNVCDKLHSISLPNSIKSIKRFAFASCLELPSIEIPNNVEEIGEYAFHKCIFSTISIPNSVKLIDFWGFAYCSSLKKVTMGSNLNTIGAGAFLGCTSLESIEIPNSVTNIGNSAFMECSSLISVKLSENLYSISAGTFYGCIGLPNVTIPNSVTQIDSNFLTGGAFQNCPSLSTLTIGMGIISIGAGAFADCVNLSDVTCLATNVPTTDVEAFKGTYINNATLHVPYSSLNSYSSTSPWSGFKDIVSLPRDSYTLTYMVDGEAYQTYELYEGDAVTSELEPTKEGYTFSGWSDIPATMPANDVSVIGSFSINKYNLIYKVDGEVYKSYEIEYGATITPETEPTKEGYDFSGWSEIPVTMPAMDIEVIGSFTEMETNIKSINVDIHDHIIFDTKGNRRENYRKGVNILRTNGGITKKVLVK